MKKLGKRLNTTKQTLQAYGCPCGCDCNCPCNDFSYQNVSALNGRGINASTAQIAATTA